MIGISLLTLFPGRVGGSETYARSFLRGLKGTSNLEYTVLLQREADGVGGGLHEVHHHYPGVRPVQVALAAADPRVRRELAKCEVVHFPLTVPVPPVRGASVVTLHDVQHLDLPQLFSSAQRLYRRVAYDRAARTATRVIVLSNFQKLRVAELLGLDENQLRVVHSGVDHERYRPGSNEREDFLLYPAFPWPHKNHGRLFDAFAELRRARPDLRLILTGGGRFEHLPEGVDARGLVPPAELVSLYRRAAALVFPSLYEGFGQPPLEAMACGCPVACSTAGALPELVGDAARLFDPHSVEAIAEAVEDVLRDPSEWISRGLERASIFSWDTSARGHDAVYRELL